MGLAWPYRPNEMSADMGNAIELGYLSHSSRIAKPERSPEPLAR